MSGTCSLCGDTFGEPDEPDMTNDMAAALAHLSLWHPKEYGEGPETWPDGSYVVVDDTLEPGDFG